MKFARRMQSIQPSATLAMAARAGALRALGRDVVNFGAGEPDFDTPAHITDAMVEAARKGATRYLPVPGLPALREACARWFTELYGVPYTAAETLVSTGGKQSLYNLFQVLLDPGDEVIVPAPYWVSYPEMVSLAEGVPVFAPGRLDEGFRVAPEDVEAQVTARTVGIVLNSPSNPAGAVLSKDDLLGIAAVAERHDLWIVTDDIYSAIRYGGGRFENVLTVRPDLKERVFVSHGCAKTYGMTGWRIGFTGAPKAVIDQCSTLQGQSTSNATTFSQHGALAALTGDHSFLEGWLAAYDARRLRIVQALNDVPGVRCALPGGAFYVLPDFRDLLGRRHAPSGTVLTSDVTLCELLLEHVHVAAVPGTPFGAPGFIRLSYACSMETIEKGLSRIAAFVKELTP